MTDIMADSDFRSVRRKDRLTDDGAAWKLLSAGEYGFLAMHGLNGYAYGIPINFVLCGESIYFHCAPQGYKLDCLRSDDRVSFCVVGPTRVIPDQFSTAYESAMAFGRIRLGLSEQERLRALDLLVEKYCPGFAEKSKTYIARSFPRTEIMRLDIEHVSGKAKRIKTK